MGEGRSLPLYAQGLSPHLYRIKKKKKNHRLFLVSAVRPIHRSHLPSSQEPPGVGHSWGQERAAHGSGAARGEGGYRAADKERQVMGSVQNQGL